VVASAHRQRGEAHCRNAASPDRPEANTAQMGRLHRRLKGRKHPLAKKPERRCIMPSVNPVPEGYSTLTPYLIVADGAAAVAFYEKVFGARLRLKLERPDGKLGHTELEIGDSVVMLADEHPAHQAHAPAHFGGSPVTLHLYVENVDAVVGRARAAGGKITRPVDNMFYGDRSGSFVDPFGHVWHVATHIEDVPPDEINRRAAAAMQKG